MKTKFIPESGIDKYLRDELTPNERQMVETAYDMSDGVKHQFLRRRVLPDHINAIYDNLGSASDVRRDEGGDTHEVALPQRLIADATRTSVGLDRVQEITRREQDASTQRLDARTDYFVKACSPRLGLGAHAENKQTQYSRSYPAWISAKQDVTVEFDLDPKYGYDDDAPDDGNYYRVCISGADSGNISSIAFVSQNSAVRSDLRKSSDNRWFVAADELGPLLRDGDIMHCEIDGESIAGEEPTDIE